MTTPQIIIGLHIDVASAELKSLLQGRLKFHEDKASFYEKQLGEMRKIDTALAEAQEFSKVTNRGPMESLEQSIKKHRDQVVFYRFTADHVVPDAIYRLSESDLTRLGMTERLF